MLPVWFFIGHPIGVLGWSAGVRCVSGNEGYTGGSNSSLPPVEGIAGSPLLRAMISCFSGTFNLQFKTRKNFLQGVCRYFKK